MAVKNLIHTISTNRFLILELVIRTVKLRYRGSILGYLWTMLNPLIFMLIYTLIFVGFLRVKIECFPIFLFVGLLPWTWFAESINQGVNIFVSQGGFLKNAVFPGEVLPVVSVMSSMVNFLFALPILFVMLFYYGKGVTIHILALPLVMAVQFIFCIGLVFIFATYNVYYRDVHHLISLAVQALFFLTPVLYDVTRIPEKYQIYILYSPTALLVGSYRSIFFEQTWPNFLSLFLLLLFSLGVLGLGVSIYEKNRELIAESL